MKQNYPNPFNPTTKIEYSLNKSSDVKMILYDIAGREIKTLVNESKTAGKYVVDLNGNNLSSGTYFYQLIVDGVPEAKKMILTK